MVRVLIDLVLHFVDAHPGGLDLAVAVIDHDLSASPEREVIDNET
jgi:hypothetical protein